MLYMCKQAFVFCQLCAADPKAELPLAVLLQPAAAAAELGGARGEGARQGRQTGRQMGMWELDLLLLRPHLPCLSVAPALPPPPPPSACQIQTHMPGLLTQHTLSAGVVCDRQCALTGVLHSPPHARAAAECVLGQNPGVGGLWGP